MISQELGFDAGLSGVRCVVASVGSLEKVRRPLFAKGKFDHLQHRVLEGYYSHQVRKPAHTREGMAMQIMARLMVMPIKRRFMSSGSITIEAIRPTMPTHPIADRFHVLIQSSIPLLQWPVGRCEDTAVAGLVRLLNRCLVAILGV